MQDVYSADVKIQLQNIKEFIALDNKRQAIEYLKKIKEKIEILGKYPYIGKVNATMDNANIREFVILGYKVIYKINEKSITILAIYKYIDFDEDSI
ncbi:MAG TPA: type II toxin-antitoxin system RelE/ParE family toxin [Campylobacterales bacterium]|nr:type II toxin-antitoxin system RelE/ParE family toxin [Campylobacterales bacterium]